MSSTFGKLQCPASTQSQLPPETTTAKVGEYFTPVYLHHRYQLNAIGKMLGGVYYEYGYSDQGSESKRVPPFKQLEALEVVLGSLAPEHLRIPTRVQQQISPQSFSTIRDKEVLAGRNGRTFDSLSAARIATDLVLDELLQPQRLARLSLQSRDEPRLKPESVVAKIADEIWRHYSETNNLDSDTFQLGCVVRETFVERLIRLLDDQNASTQVRLSAYVGLLHVRAKYLNDRSIPRSNFMNMLSRRIEQSLRREMAAPSAPSRLDTPPGSPIGSSR